MKIYTHRAKNDLTVWAPDKVWGARYQPSYPLEKFLSKALMDNTTALWNGPLVETFNSGKLNVYHAPVAE